MLQIIAVNNELFIQGQCQRVSFNGTPLTRVENAEVVGQVNNLREWQSDPGRYTRACAVAHVTPRNGESFIMGGSWLYITAWCQEHGASIAPTTRMFDDRNVARRIAGEMGGVTV